MEKNKTLRVLLAVVAALLAIYTALSCYFDLSGIVEIRDSKDNREEKAESGLVITLPKDFDISELENAVFGKHDGKDAEKSEGKGDSGDEKDKAENNGSTDAGDAGSKQNEALPTWEASGEYSDKVDILILVNKENPVDENYVPEDLVQLKYRASNREAKWQVMTRVAADAFNKMCEDALAEGYEIVATTAYRSYGFQSYLYNSYVEKDGQELADTYSARPGKSEHQTGLATDVSSPSVNYTLTKEYGSTPEGKWLAENCYKYGFILRYQKGKEEITGYMYEPWHIRYVGQEAAKEIWENDLTLEEYLAEK